NAFTRDLPLLVAFAVLAAYTYSSGLRAPALIAFVKDFLIYLVIIVATVWMAWKVGFGHLFDQTKSSFDAANKAAVAAGRAPRKPFIPGEKQYLAYGTLALGSALALFIYPHSITGVLASRSRGTIRRNCALLPLYSLMLALLALLGYAAIAVGTKPIGLNGKP